MASIRKEIIIDTPAAHAWDAVRDYGALHTRLVPGFVTACTLDGDARLVTFGNGMTSREQRVTLDDAAQRLVWTIVGGRFTHHNGALQIVADGDARCRAVWITDLLPDELAAPISAMQDQGMAIMKRTLEGSWRR
ncbi:MAG TPA: SRPBCC family protein [Nevskiaceae bacterium]|nr:SRPBCC family protein [Nevskiaceae bacterium]